MGLDDMREMMDSCVRCSQCKFIPALAVKSKKYSHICPSVERYNFHAYSGGGRLIMANALNRGRVAFTPEMLNVLYSCTNCGGCEVSCKWVYDLEPNEVIHELRVAAVECGAGPLPKHKSYIDLVKRKSNPYGEPPEARRSWMPNDVALTKGSSTLYFVGCTAAYRREEIAVSTARVLNAAGMEFDILGSDEMCCGSPVLRVGDRKSAVEIMRKNVELFVKHGVTKIVTSCSGCYNMFHTEYPRYVEMPIEVVHTSQVMESLVASGKLKLNREVPMTVTYHDPCHLGRMSEKYEHWEGQKVEVLTQVYMYDPPKPERRGASGVYDAPRNVLKAIPGIRLAEMERIREYAYCCGAGAGVKAAMPDFALWTASRRIEEAESTGAEVLVSACPFCSTNFRDGLASRKSSMRYLDLSEIVWMSIGGDL